ncbi:hypothetical protein LSAT2_011182 [Lamellibrachia satsuma]|nr:hypothetical protein LSAT2_011182 [Lamellibrachia satsuma]
MILEDSGMRCRVVSMNGANGTEPSPVTTPTPYETEVVLPSNEQPGLVRTVVNPSDVDVQLAEQKADLAELMTSLAATYNSPHSDTLVLVDTK